MGNIAYTVLVEIVSVIIAPIIVVEGIIIQFTIIGQVEGIVKEIIF